MRTQISEQQYDEERALYHLQHADVIDCTFAGPADGESVLKEARDIHVQHSRFSLRYPMWHVKGFKVSNTTMDEMTRAALWYIQDGVLEDSKLNGIKAVRECDRLTVDRCDIQSQEFGWKSKNIIVRDSMIASEYLFLDSRDVKLERVKMSGKYSFQYMENLEIIDSELDTKDAFWHSKNVVVRNSIVKGEYLGWFSDGLTLINCKIIGTQPLCYCENLKLINCTMEDTDLSFEYSDVDADIRGNVLSIKNPKSGTIIVDNVGEVIWDDPVMECSGEIKLRKDIAKESA